MVFFSREEGKQIEIARMKGGERETDKKNQLGRKTHELPLQILTFIFHLNKIQWPL